MDKEDDYDILYQFSNKNNEQQLVPFYYIYYTLITKGRDMAKLIIKDGNIYIEGELVAYRAVIIYFTMGEEILD